MEYVTQKDIKSIFFQNLLDRFTSLIYSENLNSVNWGSSNVWLLTYEAKKVPFSAKKFYLVPEKIKIVPKCFSLAPKKIKISTKET